jgi:hypothetical protein
VQGAKIEINSAIRVLSSPIALFLLFLCMLALLCMLSRWIKMNWWMGMEKLLCSQLVPGTNKQFLGARLDRSKAGWLLARAKSATQAKRQHVLFAWKTSACSYCILHCRRLISTAME